MCGEAGPHDCHSELPSRYGRNEEAWFVDCTQCGDRSREKCEDRAAMASWRPFSDRALLRAACWPVAKTEWTWPTAQAYLLLVTARGFFVHFAAAAAATHCILAVVAWRQRL